MQTIGSAGESLAAGVVFTIPALIFAAPLGPAYFNYFQITVLAIAGGILGVLMMIPLRRALIVKEHGVLPYPKGPRAPTSSSRANVVERLPKRSSWDSGSARCGRRCPDRSNLPHGDRLFVPSNRLLPERDDQPRSVAGYGLRRRSADRGRNVRGRCCRGSCCCRSVVSRQLHDSAVAARSRERSTPRSDVSGADVERAHPLYGCRRGAGGRADYARQDDPDDRDVVSRKREGLRSWRQRRPRPDRARHAAERCADWIGRARRVSSSLRACLLRATSWRRS